MSTNHTDAVERARNLIMELAHLRATPKAPLPGDMQAVASMVDAWLRDIGHPVSDNTNSAP